VHACLERRDFEGLKELERLAGSARFEAAPLIEWARTSPDMKPATGAGSADAASDRDVWTELAFEVPVAHGIEGSPPAVLVGSLDRLVREGSRYTIIDFKITEEPKSAEALREAYGTQMELYALGLRCLEPEARDVSAVLVNISAGSFHAVEASLGQLDAQSLARKATEIVAGRKGAPQPGELCRFCDFRSVCDEGRRRR
jgi:ATP-dependent exoDNAse (exonuclease V) beta subunit